MQYKKYFLTYLLSFFVFSSFSTEYLQASQIKQPQVISSFFEKIKQFSAYQLFGATLFVGFCGFVGCRFLGKWFSKKPFSRPNENGSTSEKKDPVDKKEPAIKKPEISTPVQEELEIESINKEEKIEDLQSDSTNETKNEKLNSKPILKKQKIVEAGNGVVKNQKSVTFKDQHQEFNSALNDLNNFVQSQKEKIWNKINRISDKKEITENIEGIEFELVGSKNENELLQEMSSLCSALKNKFEPVRKILKNVLLQNLEKNIQTLDDVRESVSNVMLLFADNGEDVFDQVNNSLKHLSGFGMKPEKIYERLGLSSANRMDYSINDILAQCNAFNEVYDANSDTGKQVRQIKFTIGNPIGKKIYDAWLSDKEKNTKNGYLAMLRISTEDAKKFGIDFNTLNEPLLTCKAELDQFKKQIS